MMANNHSQRISTTVHSSAYDPNSLSIFPDLLQLPVMAMETQQQLEPPSVPQHFASEDEICPLVRFCTIVENLAYTTLDLDGLSEFHGAGGAVTPRSTMNTHHTRRAPLRTREPARPRTLARQRHSSVNQNSGVPLPPHEEPEAELPVENNVNCPICMVPFFQPTTTRCGHVFCKNCITHALVEKKHCPICRKRVTKRDLFRIYLS